MADGTSARGAKIKGVLRDRPAVACGCSRYSPLSARLRRILPCGRRRAPCERAARLHSLGRHHLACVLPYRHPRARQRQHRHHERHAHHGKKGGVAVFVLDFGKGVASGLLALGALWLLVPGAGLLPEAAFPTYDQTLSAAFLGCVLGHIFSPWLDFQGREGALPSPSAACSSPSASFPRCSRSPFSPSWCSRRVTYRSGRWRLR